MEERKKAAVTELRVFGGTSGKSKRTHVKARDFYSLSYRYYGKTLIRSAQTEFISEQNCVTFMPKNTSYETEILEDTRMAVIHFKLDNDIDFRNPAMLTTKDKGVQLLFEKLMKSYRVDSPLDFSCMAVFYELLAKLEQLELQEYGAQIPKKIRLAREYMLEGFSDPLFSVSSLADRLGISTPYLRREFSAAYKKSPIAFLRELRIENAKNLLQSEYLSIEEIAAQSGFSSASYFIQVFHKAVGDPPDRYRQSSAREKALCP